MKQVGFAYKARRGAGLRVDPLAQYRRANHPAATRAGRASYVRFSTASRAILFSTPAPRRVKGDGVLKHTLR